MKNNKSIILILSVFYIFIFNTSFAEEWTQCEKNIYNAIPPDPIIDEIDVAEGYRLYQCRVQDICEKEYFEKINKAIVYDTNTTSNKYDEEIVEFGLDNAKEKYRNNINNIYKCWLLKVQKDSLALIKDKLLSIDKWGWVKDKIDRKLSLQITKIDIKFDQVWCIDTRATTIQNKFNILNQATYELCKHHSYLEFLKEYNSDINNVLFIKTPEWEPKTTEDEKNSKEYSVKDVANIITNVQSNIELEIDHSYKMFPLAFHAYSEYENNYPIHVLLQLIREDYMVLRQKLYAALNPINQVVYKIANAMSMD